VGEHSGSRWILTVDFHGSALVLLAAVDRRPRCKIADDGVLVDGHIERICIFRVAVRFRDPCVYRKRYLR
jgi:hypothetical protein